MSVKIVEEQVPEPEESGGIVTTVKAEESKDLDFQSRLRQMKIDAGEDPDADEQKPQDDEEAKPNDDEAPAKAAKKPEGEEANDDWQKNLTPAQRKEVNALYKDRKRTSKELRAATDRLNKVEAELAELKGGAGAQRASQPATKLQRPTKPDPLKFDGTPEEFAKLEEKYEDDLYAFRKQEENERDMAAKQREADKATVARFNAQVEEFSKTHEDYADTMDDAENDVNDLMFGAIVEEGPALGYYLAKHPAESAKIARMNERDAVKAIMKIVVKLEENAAAPPEPKKNKKKEEEKPAPAPTVAGRGAPPPRDKNAPMSLKDKERAAFKAGKISYDPG